MTITHGKPWWPARLSLVMTRAQAWNLVSSLLQQLRYEVVTIENPFMGKLDVDIGEEEEANGEKRQT
jgi:hypothetical protein